MNLIRSIDTNNAIVIVDFTHVDAPIAASSHTVVAKFGDVIANKFVILKKLYSKLIKTNFHVGHSPAIQIKSVSADSMRGAGISHKGKKYITHSTLPLALSAIKTVNTFQKILILTIAAISIVSFVLTPIPAFKMLVGILSIMYFSDVVFNLTVVLRSLQSKGDIAFSDQEIAEIKEQSLPIYTVLCPLYKEAHMFPQFLAAINKLDYPKEKLDVLLLLEEDDKETIKTLKKMTLPYYIKKVIVPNSLPKTKPKACNYGLSFAKGEYLVIYDAEDIPEPQQLKKAFLAFQKVSSDVQCLQAKLNYYNPRANLLTRFFTVEYALWFDIMLTGLQSFNSTLPLGGTSNHFKTAKLMELHGWDPFNVTEDADLGVRLFQKGYRTAVIDSTTHEEATSELKNWIRQRSRWLKGYMQTYFVHTRNYKDFIDQKGMLHYIIFQLTVGGKVLFILINPIMWLITILYFTSYSFAGPFLEAIYKPPISYIAVTSWIFGNFLFVYYYMVACGRKKEWDLMKYVFLMPFYWGMMSYAGVIAAHQLIFRPHYWEKTVHGFHFADSYQKYNLDKKVLRNPILAPLWSSIHLMINVTRNNILGVYNLLLPLSTNKKNEAMHHVLIYNWRDTKHLYAGGAEVYIQELAKRWVKSGSKVTIFCGNDNNSKLNEKIDGVEIVRRGGSYSVYLFGFLYYFFKFRGKVDLIIDCENGIPFFTPLYAKVPVILLIHHVHQEIFREFLKFPLRHVAAFLEGRLMPIVYRRKQIVTVSDSSMKEIVKMGFVTTNKISIISNGVTGIPNVTYPKTTYPSLLYVGRLKNYKNVDIAIKAFARVLENHKTAVLSIVGTGESYPKLKKLVKKLNVEKNVLFLGRITEHEKVRKLSQNWVMIQPSQIEGWGITVIEANACKTPVIASNVNGLKDSVVDGKTGRLVTSKNIDEFVMAMENIIQDKEYRTRLSDNAYVWAQQFDWDKSALSFNELIAQSIEEARSPRTSLAGFVMQSSEKLRTI